MKQQITVIAAAGLLLTGCGSSGTSSAAGSDTEMQYIKTSVMYDTIKDMYTAPDEYTGKYYHMVGQFYPGTDDETGEKFYSVYTEGADGHGIGIEMDGTNVSYDGLEDYDTVTVEGKLEKQKMQHDGSEIEVLILRLTSIEKREK